MRMFGVGDRAACRCNGALVVVVLTALLTYA
jgi:hypothetical protein